MGLARLSSRGLKTRPIQARFIDSVVDTEKHVHCVSCIHADTGVGKTLGYLSVALDWLARGYRVIVATKSHQLMRQIAHVELPLLDGTIEPGLYYGLTHYPSSPRIAAYMGSETFCEDTTNYLTALKSFQGTYDEFKDEFGPAPDEVDESRLTCIYGDTNGMAKQLREQALGSKLVITTHHSLLSDRLSKGALFSPHGNTALIIDEADAFIDMVESSKISTLSVLDAAMFIQAHAEPDSLALFNQMIELLTEKAKSKDLCQTELTRELVSNFMQEIRRLTAGKSDWQELFKQQNPEFLQYYPSVLLGASRVQKRPQLVISDPFLGKNVGDYLCQYHHAVLVSGTLSVKDDESGLLWVSSSLRLGERTGILAVHTPDDFGTMSLSLAAADDTYPPVYASANHLSDRWIKRVCDDILSAKGTLLVLTASHEESAIFSNRLKEMGEKRLLHTHRSGQTLKDASEPFIEQGGILITAAGHTGLNLVNDAGDPVFNKIVITRLGMSRADKDKTTHEANLMMEAGFGKASSLARIEGREFSYSLIRAVRRIKQAVGRGIRSAHHHADILICDPRFPLLHDRTAKFSLFRGAIPTRFKDDYAAASTLKTAAGTHEEILF